MPYIVYTLFIGRIIKQQTSKIIPKITTKLGVESTSMILPMQLSASMGRTISPVAGVIIATAQIAKVSTIALV